MISYIVRSLQYFRRTKRGTTQYHEGKYKLSDRYYITHGVSNKRKHFIYETRKQWQAKFKNKLLIKRLYGRATSKNISRPSLVGISV